MQPRDKLVLEFWDRSKKLSIKKKGYRDFVNEFLKLLLKNDFSDNDITTNSLSKDYNLTAYIVAKEKGTIAGLEEFKLLNNDLKLRLFKKDGGKIKNNAVIVKIKGNAKKILSRERSNLNLLQRMSGIATLTNSLNGKLKNKIKIAATRKTLWGLLDKKAVSIGGGLTHRLNLGDGIIIKDNHLKILDYNFEKVKNKSRYIEIEVENAKQALNAAKAIKNIIKKSKNRNLFAIMLDKIKPQEIKSIIKELKELDLHKCILLEASGNITPENIKKYSDCGIDAISMGYITSSAKALNMSLEVR